MFESLRGLGLSVSHNTESARFDIVGCGGAIPNHVAELFVGNSGTTVRFLTALCTLGSGQFRLDGDPRMHERPIRDLLDALNHLGADATSDHGNDCPPVTIRAAGLTGGRTHIRGDLSSQFLSGLLMVCPYTTCDAEILIDGPLVSRPYVKMTLEVMKSFGVQVEHGSMFESFRVAAGQNYRAHHYVVEPDASAASYFWAAAAITQGRVRVEGLTSASLQGDVKFCECLARMGCQVEESLDAITVTGRPLQGVDVDMNGISDTVQTLAAVALFANGPTTIRGVGHIRFKESDRIGDLARELRKFGAVVEENKDGLRIEPGPLQGAQIDTYNDHRMAMSLALVGLRVGGVEIRDPDCTAKTYPQFFADLGRLCENQEP